MSTVITPVIGRGSADSELTRLELAAIVEEALDAVVPGQRVLAIIPDKTRDDNTNTLFPIAADTLERKGVSQFDALVAQGTHPPMSSEEKLSKIGDPNFRGNIFDHLWDEPSELITLGELTVEQVSQLTGGLVTEGIPVQLNKRLAPGLYDTILVFSATVPHEVAGFAGGAKYFFPGVAGPELTHTTHWLGALAEIENVIGRIETPTRNLIEAASDLISPEIISFNSVVIRSEDGRLITHALFAGEIRDAFRCAAQVSRQVHIRYTGRKYQQVIALLDEHYDELWVGGKASYKLGGIIEDGGELIIFAPHLKVISQTHGALIEKYGYAPLESVRDMLGVSQELRENLCIAAHLAHVAYAGRIDEEGRVVPRFRITMASGLDEETCKRVNLGFIDYRTFNYASLAADANTLIVKNAGRDLYLVS